jgi:hypothetical protein
MKDKNLKFSITLACVLLLTVLTGFASAFIFGDGPTELSCGETYSGTINPIWNYVHSYYFTNPSGNDIVVTIEGESGGAWIEVSSSPNPEPEPLTMPTMPNWESLMEAIRDREEVTWLVRWVAEPGTTRYIHLSCYMEEACEYEIEIVCVSEIGTTLIFESARAPHGSSVQIPITIKNAEEIGNMDLVLIYDPSVLTATDVIKGSLTQGSMFQSNIVDGTIRIAFVDTDGISGNGSVAYITFDVVRELSTPLMIGSVRANDIDGEEVSITTINGVLTMGEIKGDCNRDGEITAVDATMALQMSVGLLEVDLVGDMNEDGEVTSSDAAEILRIAEILAVAEIIDLATAGIIDLDIEEAEITEEILATAEIIEEGAVIIEGLGIDIEEKEELIIEGREIQPEPYL